MFLGRTIRLIMYCHSGIDAGRREVSYCNGRIGFGVHDHCLKEEINRGGKLDVMRAWGSQVRKGIPIDR